MDVSFEMIDSIMQWVVLPIAYFVWMIYQRQGQHHTDIAVLQAQQEANKIAQDREMNEMKETIRAIFQKLDTIEQALRKQGDDVDKLPKVNIGIIAVICSSLGGMVWYASEQASIISNLEETVAVLDAKSNTTERVNMVRDIKQNQEHLQEIIDILAEVYEDMEDGDNEIWEDIDMINEDMGGMASHMMEIIKLQSRIAILEKTVEFSRNDGMQRWTR